MLDYVAHVFDADGAEARAVDGVKCCHVAQEAHSLALHVLVRADAQLGQQGAAPRVEYCNAAVGSKSEVAQGA